MDIAFTSSDVWVLLSIALSETDVSPVRLKDVFFAGDAINKAIFTPQELRRGMAKLTQAGYVRDELGAYSLTSYGRELVERARAQSSVWLGMWDWLDKELSAKRSSEDRPTYEDSRFPYPQLTDALVAEAEREYRDEFAKQFSELKLKRP
jgi:hypothetical protein